jgi:HD-GYP domain-containing protein (c-di-GMP phosphodiesterase class II)
MAVSRSGSWFDPALVKLLLSLRSDREFWRSVQDERTIVDLGLLEPNEMQIVEDEERLDRVAEAFALVIDAKSPYTYRHSTRVAELAVAAGSALDMDRDALRELRRAGFLHDIGKLAVPTRSSTSPAG